MLACCCRAEDSGKTIEQEPPAQLSAEKLPAEEAKDQKAAAAGDHQAKSPRAEITIVLEKSADQKLGLDLAMKKARDPPELRVKRVKPGLVEDFNKNSATHKLVENDLIVSVNGERTQSGMMTALAQHAKLEFKIIKG